MYQFFTVNGYPQSDIQCWLFNQNQSDSKRGHQDDDEPGYPEEQQKFVFHVRSGYRVRA